MSIFDVDYINVVWKLLVPPDKRRPKWLDWGGAVMQGKQWKGNAFFECYAQGAQSDNPPYWSAVNAYNTSTAYTAGDRVIYSIQAAGAYYGDNAVYECLFACTGMPPAATNIVPDIAPAYAVNSATALTWLDTGNMGNPFYWVKISNNFIGANERASYSCQKLIYEFALNKWFNTTFRQPATADSSDSGSDIFITNNTIGNDNFYFFPFTTKVAGNFLPKTNISDKTKTLSKYFFPSNVFTASFDFSINIPVGVYNYLYDEASVTAGNNTVNRDNVVKAFANLLCPAGASYNIITY